VSRVAQCLAQNKPQLSTACAAVFDRPAAASTAQDRPRNLLKSNY
jgi:hypothetical protein